MASKFGSNNNTGELLAAIIDIVDTDVMNGTFRLVLTLTLADKVIVMEPQTML